jgi:hypothetical protein
MHLALRKVGGDKVTDPWEKIELLPGTTAKQWARRGLYCIVVMVLAMLGALARALTVVSQTQRWDPLTLGFLALIGPGLLGAWILNLVSEHKEKAEVRAGYTTCAQGNNEVIRVHSPTGVVMREAGQPDLDKPDWLAAMIRVDAYRVSRRGAGQA